MQGLEDVDAVTQAGELAGHGQAARAGSDHGDLVAGGGDLWRDELGVGRGPVGDEALEPADGHRLALLAAQAEALALHLLRADAAGGRRQGVVGEQHFGGAGEIGDRDALEKLGDAHLDRAAGHAGAVLAGDAAVRLAHGELFGQAQVDLGEVGGALGGVLFGHGDTVDRHALLAGEPGLVGGRSLGGGLGENPAAVLVDLVIGRLAAGELVEIDLVAVELGAVDAGELGLAADRDAAAAAHAGAVDHEGVQRDGGGHAILGGQIDDGLHHRHRADGVDGRRAAAVLVLQQTLEGSGDEAGLAKRTVFGGQQQLVGDGAELVAQHDVGRAAPADDGDELVAGPGQRLGERKEHGGAGAAAHADDPADLADVGGLTERPGDVTQRLAGGHGHDVLGAAPHGLDDESDGAGHRIVVGDGQGNALALVAGTDDDELTGLARAGHTGGGHDHAMKLRGDLLVADDFEHADLGFGDRTVMGGAPRPRVIGAGRLDSDRACGPHHPCLMLPSIARVRDPSLSPVAAGDGRFRAAYRAKRPPPAAAAQRVSVWPAAEYHLW